MNAKSLQQARPRLSKASPLTSYICWGFAGVNLVIGLGLFSLYNTPVPIAIVNILSYQGWGILFFGLGLMTLYSLVANNWELIRASQFAGIALKATWAIALIFRCFIDPRTILITAVWVFFAYVQAGIYIYFFPPKVPE